MKPLASQRAERTVVHVVQVPNLPVHRTTLKELAKTTQNPKPRFFSLGREEPAFPRVGVYEVVVYVRIRHLEGSQLPCVFKTRRWALAKNVREDLF